MKDPTRVNSVGGQSDLDLPNGYNSPAVANHHHLQNGTMPNGYQKMHLQKLGGTNFLGFLSPNAMTGKPRQRSASSGAVLMLSANKEHAKRITLTHNLVEQRALEMKHRTKANTPEPAIGNGSSIEFANNNRLTANRSCTLSNSVTELRNLNKRKRPANSLSEDVFMAKFSSEDTFGDHQKPRRRNQVLSNASSYQSVFFGDSIDGGDEDFSPGFKKTMPSNPRKPNLISASTPARARHQSADQSEFLSRSYLAESRPPDFMMISAMKHAYQNGHGLSHQPRAKRCTLSNSSTELRKIDEKYDTNLWNDTDDVELFLKPGKIETRPKNGLDLFFLKLPRTNSNPLLEAIITPQNGFTSPTDSSLSPSRSSKNEPNYSKKRVVPTYDRDKTYFPFGKPGSGAPLKDEMGKLKTNLNGKFITDYYRLEARDPKLTEKRKQMLDEQKVDVTLAERKRREMALQLRGNEGSSLDFAEKIRSFSDLYPNTTTTRGSSDVTRQRLNIRPVDPLEGRLYKDELAKQSSEQKDFHARQHLEECQQEAKHESTMNENFLKRQGHGAPSTYRPTGNRRIRLDESLYPNKTDSSYQVHRLFPVPMKKSNSETDVTKSMTSPRQSSLFWWLNNPQPMEYRLQAPFATSNET